MEEAELAREQVATPEEDFEGFFERLFKPLARALLLLTRDRGEAEDLAQEAMARVYERWAKVRSMDSPDGYLYRTALNLQRKRLRRLAVRERPRRQEGVRDELERVEERNEVLEMLGTLPAGQREALVLVDWLGMATEEAARVLKIEPVSVRSRLHRGRAVLRERFGAERDE